MAQVERSSSHTKTSEFWSLLTLFLRQPPNYTQLCGRIFKKNPPTPFCPHPAPKSLYKGEPLISYYVQNYCPELLCKALRIGTISLPDVQRLPIEFKKPSVKMAASISCLCKSADPRKEIFIFRITSNSKGFTITYMEMTKNARKTQVGRLKRN